MTATTYVRADKDELVIDVTGADPNSTQTARINLQNGRNPTAGADGAIARLAETWVDTGSSTGGTGKTFGSLAAVTAGGRERDRRAWSTRAPSRSPSSPTPTALPRHRRLARRGPAATPQATAATLLGSDATAPASAPARRPPAVVARLLGQGRPDPPAVRRRHRGLHGEPAHALPLRRRAPTERGTFPTGQAGTQPAVQLQPRQPGLGRRPLLVLEHAHAPRGQPGRGQHRREPAALPPLPRQPREHPQLDAAAHGRAARHLRAGDDALRRHRLVHGHRRRQPELLRRAARRSGTGAT